MMVSFLKSVSRTTIVFLFIFETGIVSAQSIKTADKSYDNFNYVSSAEEYSRLGTRRRKPNAHIYRRAAESYKNINDNVKALEWYQRLMDTGEQTPRDMFNYSLVLATAGDYKGFEKWMTAYCKTTPDNNECLKILSRGIGRIEAIRKGDDRYQVIFIGDNSESSDFGPSFYGDDIVFASARGEGNSSNVYDADDFHFLNLYHISKKDRFSPGKAKVFAPEANTIYHDGPAAFSSDLKTMYLTRNIVKGKNKKRLVRGNDKIANISLFVFKKNGDNWEEAGEFPYSDANYSTGQATLSPDNTVILFVSNRPGTSGRSDLWQCRLQADGTWGEPENLGGQINTPGREMFPFLTKNGDLYFASDGRVGLGGLDIYKVSGFLEGNREVENIGAPFNTPYDDFALIENPKTMSGYFSSNRKRGFYDDDIYMFKLSKSNLNVCVIDRKTQKSVPDVRLYFKKPDGTIIDSAYTGASGCLTKKITSKKLTVEASKKGYLNWSKPDISRLKWAKEMDVKIFADKKEPLLVHLNPVYYDFDKSNIREDAKPILDEVVNLMTKYPNIKINLSSYTDSRGSDAYNDALSQRRAESALDYLVSKGISKDRITARGYGERFLKNKCADGVKCSEAEHSENRRTEFDIEPETQP